MSSVREPLPFAMYLARARNGARYVTLPGTTGDNVSQAVLHDLTGVPLASLANGHLQRPSETNAAGIQLELVSSDADDSVGGGGIEQVRLVYLDGDGLEQSELVTMTGETPVNTVATDITEVQWCNSIDGYGVGNIDVRNTAGTIVYERISAGGAKSLSARYVIPSNRVGYFVTARASAAQSRMTIFVRATVDQYNGELIASGTFNFVETADLDDSATWFDLHYQYLPPLAVAKISALAEQAGGDASGSVTLLLE